MRLIDADEFIKRNARIIDCEIDHPKYQDILRELIDDAPSIDIVRCKECKHLEQRLRFGNYPSGDKENFCAYHWKFDFKADDFCSYGERSKE